ncbi:MAG: OmpA family protein [Saprospiraceae bacterium]|nr:OmpA family protein [Saprospiraceae bacterium]
MQRVEIIGFSDDVGTDMYNLKLSEERAKQIALHLMDKGIIVDQIYIEGRGEIRDDKPKNLNRKVEIKVTVIE